LEHAVTGTSAVSQPLPASRGFLHLLPEAAQQASVLFLGAVKEHVHRVLDEIGFRPMELFGQNVQTGVDVTW
jgi:hypothetical protein